MGGRLREAADAIITIISDGIESPLFALEYCGALPAGNQAWQRHGRAFSFAHARVPYFYITEIGGYELTADRVRKSVRLPNPAVPFSFLALSASLGSIAVPVFVPSPGASEESIRIYAPIFGEGVLLKILRSLVLLQRVESPFVADLESKCLNLTGILSSARRVKDTLNLDQWNKAYNAINNGILLSTYLKKYAPLKWSKTAYIAALTITAKRLMSISAAHAIGLTSATLPLCIIPSEKRLLFKENVLTLYPDLPENFFQWLSKSEDLAICWIMGFKPRGDDARPDRGLPPLCRMLIGDQTDMLTVVYGPAPPVTWPLLHTNPGNLIQQNGLWESILAVSNAVLIDSSTLNQSKRLAYLREHWISSFPMSQPSSIFVQPAPVQVGEQDVDTVIHLLFSVIGGPQVFEGMCNPPGGDWGGISLLTEDRSKELRWLGLPRVTSEGAKRPDHVFQVFDEKTSPIILVVESKERANQVEDKIGSRLKKYLRDLIGHPPSIERSSQKSPWIHSNQAKALDRPLIASIVAFVSANSRELESVAQRADTDLIFGFDFNQDRTSCNLLIRSCSDLGNRLLKFVGGLPLNQFGIKMAVYQ